jgi:hypothetical protein
MAIITTGAIATAAGLVWKYWRGPVRLIKWRLAEETEPAVGQIWTEAKITGPDSKWKITKVEEDYLTIVSTTDKDGADDFLEDSCDWATWEKVYIKNRKFYCSDRNDTAEDAYFGESAE